MCQRVWSVLDTDECLQDDVCGRGQCVNVDGGFECQCYDGYAAGVDGTCEGLQSQHSISWSMLYTLGYFNFR